MKLRNYRKPPPWRCGKKVLDAGDGFPAVFCWRWRTHRGGCRG